MSLQQREDEPSLRNRVNMNPLSLGSTPHGNTTDRENQEDMHQEREKIAFENDLNEMNQEMAEMLEQMDSSRYLQNQEYGEMQMIEQLDLSTFQPPEENNFGDGVFAIDLGGKELVFIDDEHPSIQNNPQRGPQKSSRTAAQ